MSLCGREGAPYREVAENVYGAGVKEWNVQRGCGECVRCEKEEVHRTERLRRMCMVRKSESAPYREAVENVYGAKKRKCTVQRNCVECVRCGSEGVHRTERLWRMCTVQK